MPLNRSFVKIFNFFAYERIGTPVCGERPEDGWDSEVLDHPRYRKAFSSQT